MGLSDSMSVKHASADHSFVRKGYETGEWPAAIALRERHPRLPKRLNVKVDRKGLMSDRTIPVIRQVTAGSPSASPELGQGVCRAASQRAPRIDPDRQPGARSRNR